jgi:hypothetical protein
MGGEREGGREGGNLRGGRRPQTSRGSVLATTAACTPAPAAPHHARFSGTESTRPRRLRSRPKCNASFVGQDPRVRLGRETR